MINPQKRKFLFDNTVKRFTNIFATFVYTPKPRSKKKLSKFNIIASTFYYPYADDGIIKLNEILEYHMLHSGTKELIFVEVLKKTNSELAQSIIHISNDGKRRIKHFKLTMDTIILNKEIFDFIVHYKHNNKMIIFNFVGPITWEKIVRMFDAMNLSISSGGNNKTQLSRLHFKLSLFVSWLYKNTDLTIREIGDSFASDTGLNKKFKKPRVDLENPNIYTETFYKNLTIYYETALSTITEEN